VLGKASSFSQRAPEYTYTVISTVQNLGDWDVGGAGAQARASLNIAAGVVFEDYGTFDVDGLLLAGGGGAFVNNGSLKIEHGTAQFASVATGTQSGSFVIGEDGALEFTGKAGNTAVGFEPGEAGRLLINSPMDAGTVRTVIGFDNNDSIRFVGNGDTAVWAQTPGADTGTLTVAGPGGVAATINMTGRYAPDAFKATPDAVLGVTTITTSAPQPPEPPPPTNPATPRTVTDPVLDLADHGRRDATLTGNGPNDFTVRLHDETIRATSVQRIEFVDGEVTFAGNGTQPDFTLDPEAASIARMYYTVLGRAPEFDGLYYWSEHFMEAGNRNLNRTAPHFCTSPEFRQRYGENLSDTQLVTKLYENILGRDPTGDSGFQFWMNRLAEGASRPDIVVGISESPEHINRRAAVISEETGIEFAGIPWLNDTSLLL
jgi:hypothetical protein